MTGEEERTKTYMKNADKQDLGQWSGRHLWSPETIRTLDRDDGQGTQTAVNTTQWSELTQPWQYLNRLRRDQPMIKSTKTISISSHHFSSIIN